MSLLDHFTQIITNDETFNDVLTDIPWNTVMYSAITAGALTLSYLGTRNYLSTLPKLINSTASNLLKNESMVGEKVIIPDYDYYIDGEDTLDNEIKEFGYPGLPYKRYKK